MDTGALPSEMYLLYYILTVLGMFVIAPYYALRGWRRGEPRSLAERFGVLPQEVASRMSEQALWDGRLVTVRAAGHAVMMDNPTEFSASVVDFPERWVKSEAARAELKDGAVERLKVYWTLLEQALKPAPYLLGSEMTAHCPRVASALALAEEDPIVARVWERNFKR